MAGKGLRGLNEAMRSLSLSSQFCKEVVNHRIPSTTFARSMATETSLPNNNNTTSGSDAPPSASATPLWRPATTVPLTIFDFPSYEPARLESWSAKHLNLPLRRDILHLAVVYEGDSTRQGTASSKTRWDVRGSGRKLGPQKGSGRARMGDKNSPIRRGGGKVFGPHPRDFSTRLPRKVYDLAWRTALSYRYRRGELIVCNDGMDLSLPEEYFRGVGVDGAVGGGARNSSPWWTQLPGKDGEVLRDSFRAKWARQVLDANEWGRAAGRSTFITSDPREDLFAALEQIPRYGTALEVADVDVKDLLETGRIVVERSALLDMLERHQSDLAPTVFVAGSPLPPRAQPPVSGEVLVE